MRESVDGETLGQLIALLAHDLRNPLSALHSNVGFLESVLESGDEDVREALEDARVSCDGLMYIIDNLELLGRALSESAPVPTMRLGLMPVLEEVVARHQPLAQSHGVSLELVSSTASPQVRSNREMLQRAAGNLIRNGIQHGLAGGTVKVHVGSEGGDTVVRVEDSGTAISTELVERAFLPEVQMELKNATGGRYSRGLGLYAARVAADTMGARVQASPRPGGSGSILELRLPTAS